MMASEAWLTQVCKPFCLLLGGGSTELHSRCFRLFPTDSLFGFPLAACQIFRTANQSDFFRPMIYNAKIICFLFCQNLWSFQSLLKQRRVAFFVVVSRLSLLSNLNPSRRFQKQSFVIVKSLHSSSYCLTRYRYIVE